MRHRALQITAENDEVARGLIDRFTGFFRDMHAGRRSGPLTKMIVANVLIDEEPTMVDEYLELFDKCCNTFAWAGKVSPPPEEWAMITPSPGGNEAGDAQPNGPGASPLQPSASGIADISTAAEAQEVGTVSGSSSARRGNRTAAPSQRPTRGKREWLAMAKRLVPEGRGSYALWFTCCNIAIIISVFAYMAGDYAMWVKENRGSFLADDSIPANTDADAEVRPLHCHPHSPERAPQHINMLLTRYLPVLLRISVSDPSRLPHSHDLFHAKRNMARCEATSRWVHSTAAAASMLLLSAQSRLASVPSPPSLPQHPSPPCCCCRISS